MRICHYFLKNSRKNPKNKVIANICNNFIFYKEENLFGNFYYKNLQ